MGFSSTVRKSAALCLAAFAPVGAVSFAAVAHATASPSDCAELNTLNSGFSTTVQDVIDPKELEKLANGKTPKSADAAGEALGQSMVKRLFETDPVTGRPRMELFIEHIRDLDALAHDSSGKFDDPEGAEAVQKLTDGLDGYLDFYDKLNGQQDGAQQSDTQQDESGNGDEATDEETDKSAVLDDMGPVLGAFNAGIDAFSEYSEKAGCAAV